MVYVWEFLSKVVLFVFNTRLIITLFVNPYITSQSPTISTVTFYKHVNLVNSARFQNELSFGSIPQSFTIINMTCVWSSSTQ